MKPGRAACGDRGEETDDDLADDPAPAPLTASVTAMLAAAFAIHEGREGRAGALVGGASDLAKTAVGE